MLKKTMLILNLTASNIFMKSPLKSKWHNVILSVIFIHSITFRCFFIFLNPGRQYKYDSEALKKKAQTAATFPDDPLIIRKVRQRFYASLAIRKDQDAGKRITACGDPLNGPVDGLYFRLKHAAIVR